MRHNCEERKKVRASSNFLNCALRCPSSQQTNICLLGAAAREPSASGKDLLNASFGTTTHPCSRGRAGLNAKSCPDNCSGVDTLTRKEWKVRAGDIFTHDMVWIDGAPG